MAKRSWADTFGELPKNFVEFYFDEPIEFDNVVAPRKEEDPYLKLQCRGKVKGQPCPFMLCVQQGGENAKRPGAYYVSHLPPMDEDKADHPDCCGYFGYVITQEEILAVGPSEITIVKAVGMAENKWVSKNLKASYVSKKPINPTAVTPSSELDVSTLKTPLISRLEACEKKIAELSDMCFSDIKIHQDFDERLTNIENMFAKHTDWFVKKPAPKPEKERYDPNSVWCVE